MNKKALIASLLALFVFASFVGWFLLREQKMVEYSQKPPVVGENPTQNPGNIESSTNVDTSSWKTYRNEEYGFEVKYPGEYALSENNQWPRFFQAGFSNVSSRIYFQVEVTPKDDNENDESFNIYLDHLVTSKSSLSGKEANLFILEKGYCDGPGCSPPKVALKVDLGNRFLVLVFTGVRNISEDFPQMVIKNFRFID